MQYIHGDITKENAGLIIHGVNAQGVMGSGVALAIKSRWPQIYTAYKSHVQGKAAMGQVQFVEITDELVIGNCWTQEFFGNDGKVYADKDALLKCLMAAFAFCDERGMELKSPKIASGLAGLDWEIDVVPLFNIASSFYPNVPVKVFVI